MDHGEIGSIYYSHNKNRNNDCIIIKIPHSNAVEFACIL